MMYAGSSTLTGLGFVVMDEVHYLADRFRGAVWEEVIIHLPEDVQVISLSATVSNAEEFGDWLAEVRGQPRGHRLRAPPRPAVAAHARRHDDVRPVRRGRRPHGRHQPPPGRPARLNPDLLQAIRNAEHRGRWEDEPAATRGDPRSGRTGRRGRAARGPGGGPGGRGFARGGRPGGGATRAEVVDRLDREGLLPAITFVFSRLGCEAAVAQLLAAGTVAHPAERGDADPPPRRGAGAAVSPTRTCRCSATGTSLEGLSRGFAAHHAGHAAALPGDRRGAVHRGADPRWSSPPRPSPSGSTCRRAPSSSRSSSSSTARPTPTSRRPSTPS